MKIDQRIQEIQGGRNNQRLKHMAYDCHGLLTGTDTAHQLTNNIGQNLMKFYHRVQKIWSGQKININTRDFQL